jgi:selenocysteine-specific elongation factor
LAATGDPVERARALVDAHGGIRAVEDVAAIVGEHARTTAHQSAGSSHLEQIGDVLVRADRLEPWVAAILASAAGARDEHAVESSRLTGAATAAECPPALAPAVVEHLVRAGALRRFGGRILHPDHEAAYLSARDERRRSFLDRLGADPLEPPDPAQLAVEVGIPSFEVQHLVDDDAVVACGSLLFLPQAITTAADRLREGPGRDGAAFTASEARQAWDTNRRCAVPLLDHLRATGVTTFDGDHHRIRSGHTGTDAPPG